jgi:hypothetical protein
MADPVNPECEEGAAFGTDALFEQVYERLKAMAGRQIAGGGPQTLGPTAAVHELYLRISSNRDLAFAHPDQFFTYAAQAMRHLFSDRARNRLCQRASGGWEHTTLTGSDWRLTLESGSGCGFSTGNGSKPNATLALGSLANNGGPTQTMKPGTGSTAIGQGVMNVCKTAPVSGQDQRGFTRSPTVCTSGAVDPNGIDDTIFANGFDG